MTYVAPFVWLAAGASLVGVLSRVFIAPAAWVALVALLHASRSMPPLAGSLCVWIALYAAMLAGNRGVLPVGGAAYVATVGFYAATIAAPFAIDRAAASHTRPIVSTLVFPTALVAAEFLRSRLTPAATFASFAYTQFGVLSLMQTAAFVGLWGITFAVAWFASTFEWAWTRHFDWTVVAAPVLTCGAVLTFLLSVGSIRVALAPTDAALLRAATVNRPRDLFAPGEMTRIAEDRLAAGERAQMESKLRRLQDWFLDSSRREARAGARLIAWPEQNLLVFATDEPAFLERARRLAAEEHVYLAMGMGTIHSGSPRPFENKVVLVDPSGELLMSYLKTHAVAGWEARIMQPGDGRVPVVATDRGRVAAAICYDADFPEFVRQAGRRSADLLVVPANDWMAIKGVHAKMAAFRAIENGVSLVRPAASGISMAFDPWGRMLGMTDYFAPGDGTLTVQVPVRGVRTMYAAIGDVFAWLCVAGALASVVSAALGR